MEKTRKMLSGRISLDQNSEDALSFYSNYVYKKGPNTITKHSKTFEPIWTSQKSEAYFAGINENHDEGNIVLRILKKPSSSRPYKMNRAHEINETSLYSNTVSNNKVLRNDCSKAILKDTASAEWILTTFAKILECKLANCLNYETGTLLRLSKTENRHFLQRTEINHGSFNFLTLHEGNFLTFITTSKENSLQVQDNIPAATETQIVRLVSLMKPHLKILVCNRYASYLVGRLIERSDDLANQCAVVLINGMHHYLVDEFGSRLAQQLATKLPWFRRQAIESISSLWSIITNNISPVFFINHVMKITIFKQELSPIKDCLLERTIDMYQTRYYKRVLLSFIRYCDFENLDEISKLVYWQTPLPESMNDHYLSLSISILLERGHRSTMEMIVNLKPNIIERLLKIRAFRSLCQNIAVGVDDDFRNIFLLKVKEFLVLRKFRKSHFEVLPKRYWFALWLVIRYMDRSIILKDIPFMNAIERLYREAASSQESIH